MSARRLDGTAAAAAIRAALVPQVAEFTRLAGRAPALHIVLAGDDPASQVYVRNKERAGREAGLDVVVHRLPAAVLLPDLLTLIDSLNRDSRCDAILVQSPLPSGIGKGGTPEVFDAIEPAKDADGFHPVNVGRLVQGRATLMPCTPSGIIELLVRENVPMSADTPSAGGHRRQADGAALLQRDAGDHLPLENSGPARSLPSGGHPRRRAGPAGFVTPAFVKPGAAVVTSASRRSATAHALSSCSGGSAKVAAFDAKAPSSSEMCIRTWRRRWRHARARRRTADDRDAAEEHAHRRKGALIFAATSSICRRSASLFDVSMT